MNPVTLIDSPSLEITTFLKFDISLIYFDSINALFDIKKSETEFHDSQIMFWIFEDKIEFSEDS